MTQEKQLEFIASLGFGVIQDISKKIIENKIPENWDGIELRRYLTYKFKEQEIGDFSIKRKRSYNNDILINNL